MNTETIVEAIGLGRSHTALVREIIRLATVREVLEGQKKYDADRQIWCVFDKDQKGIKGEDQDFDDAVRLAEERGLKVAYSNDAFELWFLLHDKYMDARQLRAQYYQYLSKFHKIDYVEEGKKKEFCRSLYEKYTDRQPKAIKHAKRLYHYHRSERLPSKKNPCTTVYMLVEQLNVCLKK